MTGQPYRFLRNYEFNDEDSRVFFGREREAAALVAEITNRHLVILFAPTGTGKSSLINAAVRPKLEKRGYKTLYVRPKNDPEESIRRMLKDKSLLNPDKTGLAEVLRGARELAASPLVLFLDQFEEFFLDPAHDHTDRTTPFIAAIGDLYRDRSSGIHFLFSLREDFFVEMDVFRDEIPTMFQANSSLRLRAFEPEAARKAIEGPAGKFQVKYVRDASTRADTEENNRANKEFVDLILNDLQFPGNSQRATAPGRISPIHLQIVCDTLWREHAGDFIEEAAYKKQGGVRGILRRRFQVDFAGSLVNDELDLFERLLPLLRSDERGTKQVQPVSLLPGQLQASAGKGEHVTDAQAENLVKKLVALRLIHQSPYGTIEWASDYLSGQYEQLLVDIRSIRITRTVAQAMKRSSAVACAADTTAGPKPPTEEEIEARYLEIDQFRKVSRDCEDLFDRVKSGVELPTDDEFHLTATHVQFLFEAALEHGEYLEFWHRLGEQSGVDCSRILRDKLNDPASRSSQTLSAIRLLASLETPDALESLRGVLTGDSWASSAAAAELGRYGSDGALALLKDYLQDRQPATEIEAMLLTRDWSWRARALVRIPATAMRERSGPSSRAGDRGPAQLELPPADADWQHIVKLIGDGRLIPVIGRGTLSQDMAQAIAVAVEYPGESRDLAAVAEYAECVGSRLWLHRFIEAFLASQSTTRTSDALAMLPIPVFITTRFDGALPKALRAQGRTPSLASWAPGTPSGSRDAEPTPDRPLVYQMHGSLDAGSAVLTTSDQFQFVNSSAANPDSIPIRVRASLARSSPIFLDFEPGSTEFHTVGTIVRNTRSLAGRVGYVAPAREPNPNQLSVALLKADSYRLQLRPYGGTAERFIERLVAEWRSVSYA
jgi:hypothetical protein